MALALILLTLFLASPTVISPWLLRPVWRLGCPPDTSSYFQLADMLCLMVLLSASAGVVGVLARQGSTPEKETLIAFLVLLISFWSLVGAMWWGGVHSLNGRRIKRSAPRCAYLLVAQPFAFFGLVGGNIWAAAAVFYCIDSEPSLWQLPAVVSPFVAAIISRTTCRWVAGHVEPPLDLADSDLN